jgi:hypothetical protein
LGEFQRFSPGGLFGLNSDFLRMNQAHRSAGEAAGDLTTPPPQALTRLRAQGRVASTGKAQIRVLL